MQIERSTLRVPYTVSTVNVITAVFMVLFHVAAVAAFWYVSWANVLTALVRLRNTLTGGHTIVQFGFSGVYLMDEAGAKKYPVLKDEKDDYIASSPGLYTEAVDGGGSMTLWMKFPAPPLETKTVTLAMPQMPPFENLPIHDQQEQ